MPIDLIRPVGHRAEFHDRNRTGVARQDRVRVGEYPIEFLKDLDLHRLLFQHRLHHELAVGHIGKVGGERQSGSGGVPLGLGEFSCRQPPVERLHQAGPTSFGGICIDLAHHHVEAGTGAHLGDPRTHEAATNHPNTFNCIRFHSHPPILPPPMMSEQHLTCSDPPEPPDWRATEPPASTLTPARHTTRITTTR